MDTINLYEKKISSQNGEDGIIEEIFKRIGTKKQFFVEFGVQDGSECNSSYLALTKKWSGLMIEGDGVAYQNLCAKFSSYPKVKIAHQFITKNNIVTTFKEMNVPQAFDLLSIDIDGNDYWIWRALCWYRPRLVVIEYNGHHMPPQKKVVMYNPNFRWDGSSYFGASLTSLYELGRKLGYSLLGTDSHGVNAFFIRNDLASRSGFRSLTPEEAFHPLIFGPYPKSNNPYLEI